MEESITQEISSPKVNEPELSKLGSILRSVSRWQCVIGCFGLAIMVTIVTVDVFGRDFFNVPLRGAAELTGLMLIIASTMGLGWAQWEKSHIRVPLFYDMFPPKGKLALDILTYICCFISAGLVFWQMLMLAIEYLGMPKGNVSSTLGIPLFPFMLILAWGFGWMCVILVWDLYKSVKEVIKK